jgi:hypothetical protein
VSSGLLVVVAMEEAVSALPSGLASGLLLSACDWCAKEESRHDLTELASNTCGGGLPTRGVPDSEVQCTFTLEEPGEVDVAIAVLGLTGDQLSVNSTLVGAEGEPKRVVSIPMGWNSLGVASSDVSALGATEGGVGPTPCGTGGEEEMGEGMLLRIASAAPPRLAASLVALRANENAMESSPNERVWSSEGSAASGLLLLLLAGVVSEEMSS